MSWLPCEQRLHFCCVSWCVKSNDNFYRACEKFVTRFASKIIILIVRSVVKWRKFRGEKKIATTAISYARLAQDSRNALNWSRTVKSPFFKFIRPDFWMDLNGCRQRLLFAHQLTQQKCSLCSQGMSWQVTSINISANQNAGFVVEYQVHNPFNQHFWKFLFEVKWNGL